MFIERAKHVFQTQAITLEHGIYQRFHPLSSQRFRSGLMVEVHSVQFVQQFLADVSLPRYLAVAVKLQSYLPAVMVDDVIHRADIESDTPSVLLE